MTSNYFPELYDTVTRRSLGGDIEWYLGQAMEAGGPILELGAGTGRTLLPIARQALEIVGLELDHGMAKRLEYYIKDESLVSASVILGDMREFDLGRKFNVIQIPFRAFLHNVTAEERAQCLDCCRKHLTADGVLLFNVFHPSLAYMARNSGALEGVWRWTGDFEMADGTRVMFSEANKYDTAAQRVSARHKYELVDAGGRIVDTHIQFLELAYLYPGDIREMLHLAGFNEVEIMGDFYEGPFESDGQELVVRARVR